VAILTEPRNPRICAGIDIGKETIFVALGYQSRSHVAQIRLKAPQWHKQLREVIPSGSIAALEPSGWYYAAPVVNCLYAHDVETYLVQGDITAALRKTKIGGIKNDKSDARALAFAAHQIAEKEEMRGAHPINPEDLADALSLRALVRAYDRAERETTRATNRLHQICHSVAPVLSQELETYLKLVEIGIIHPHQIREAAQQGNALPRRQRQVQAIADALPEYLNENPMAEIIQHELKARRVHAERKAELAEIIKQKLNSPTFKRLTELWQTVPYAGIMDIAKIHAATYGAAHLLTLGQMKANCGSYPEIRASGTSEVARATKRGFRPAKIALQLWLRRMQMAKLINPVTVAFERAKARHSKQATAIARAKLIEILWVIARDGKPFYNPLGGEKHA
jgi:transposase